MEKAVVAFDITLTGFIGPDGQTIEEPPEHCRNPDLLLAWYRNMVLTRTFDTKAVNLQRTGRLGTFPSSLGQEAVGAAVGSAMREDDVFLPSYREQGTLLWRGVSLLEQLLYWGGDERGSDYTAATGDFPVCIPIATQTLHAAGVATAFKIRQQPRVAVCMLGDGATSKGDFAEALNLAGAWQLPLVFVISNNQWAISVPRSRQTAAQTLAQKAIAAGVPTCQVDGNDVTALYYRIHQAVELARQKNQPGVVEAITYRLGDHTTADDARRYRPEKEVSEWWAREPVARLRNYLVGQGLWTKDDEEQLAHDCDAEVEQAVREYLDYPPAEPTAMFDYLHAELPDFLRPQRAALEGENHE